MNRTKTSILLATLLLQSIAFASSENYKALKRTVNQLESSVITKFNFSIPKGYADKFETTLQSSLSKKLESALNEQVKLFDNAESELYKIGISLEQRVKNNEISEEESKKLMTNVEYARRIILESRKQEVIEKYTDFKSKLLIKPTIQHLFHKITNVNLPGSCKIQDAHLEGNFLTFEVLGLAQDGQELTHNYVVSKTDAELGSLSTSSTHDTALAENHKSILSFKVTQNDLSLKRFNLFENKEGEFYHAEFIHEGIKEPMFEFLGLSIGENKKSEKIFCNLLGTKPASLEELQRDMIRDNFERSVVQN